MKDAIILINSAQFKYAYRNLLEDKDKNHNTGFLLNYTKMNSWQIKNV